jgi:hypothetical protein
MAGYQKLGTMDVAVLPSKVGDWGGLASSWFGVVWLLVADLAGCGAEGSLVEGIGAPD